MLIVLPLDSADAATKWTSNFVGVPALTSGGSALTVPTALEAVPIV
jgi:hypothetical protein